MGQTQPRAHAIGNSSDEVGDGSAWQRVSVAARLLRRGEAVVQARLNVAAVVGANAQACNPTIVMTRFHASCDAMGMRQERQTIEEGQRQTEKGNKIPNLRCCPAPWRRPKK